MLGDASATAARCSLSVMIELYRRHVWHDAKTVNHVASALSSTHAKLRVAALHFMLGEAEDENVDDDEEDAVKGAKEVVNDLRGDLGRNGVATKSLLKKKQRKLKRAVKASKKAVDAQKTAAASFAAIELLHDPQATAERLLSDVRQSKERWEVRRRMLNLRATAALYRVPPSLTPLLPLQVRLLMLNLASRLIGYHRLLVPNFYPFLQRYLQPHQREITLLLTFLVQASHELVPPEALQVTGRHSRHHRHRHHPLHHRRRHRLTSSSCSLLRLQPQLLHLANHFVSDKSRASMVSVGLNTIREVRTVRLASGAASDPTADPTSRRHKSAGLRARPPRHGRHSALRSDRVPQGS